VSVAVGTRAGVVRTTRGAECAYRALGREDHPPLLYLHGALGPVGDDAFLAGLAERSGRLVVAPDHPGYGASTGEGLLEDMLDFALHGWDVADALDLAHPVLVGHGMGGMIAAEMAALSPERPPAVGLIAPNGLWDDALPVPDLFALLPHEFAELLFADPAAGAAQLTDGLDFSNMDALTEFFIGNSRRLGTAGKILFPIPNRRLAKRLYRLRAPTLLAWGAGDRYLVPAYASRWQALVPHAALVEVAGAGHMVPAEQPHQLATAIAGFLGGEPPGPGS
jgi:pimeloyl-ACP methyl ester carboxylesterase